MAGYPWDRVKRYLDRVRPYLDWETRMFGVTFRFSTRKEEEVDVEECVDANDDRASDFSDPYVDGVQRTPSDRD